MSYRLRELSKNDLPYINKWRNDPAVSKTLGSPFRFINIEVDEAWFGSYMNNRSSNIRLIIVDKISSEPVGAVYLLGIDWVSRSGEFAIWIGDRSSQGKGCGKFATHKMLAHAFSDLGLNRVHLTVLADNDRAIGLYKKVGFLVEGRLRQAIFKNNEFVDLLQMAILASEHVEPEQNTNNKPSN